MHLSLLTDPRNVPTKVGGIYRPITLIRTIQSERPHSFVHETHSSSPLVPFTHMRKDRYRLKKWLNQLYIYATTVIITRSTSNSGINNDGSLKSFPANRHSVLVILCKTFGSLWDGVTRLSCHRFRLLSVFLPFCVDECKRLESYFPCVMRKSNQMDCHKAESIETLKEKTTNIGQLRSSRMKIRQKHKEFDRTCFPRQNCLSKPG